MVLTEELQSEKNNLHLNIPIPKRADKFALLTTWC